MGPIFSATKELERTKKQTRGHCVFPIFQNLNKDVRNEDLLENINLRFLTSDDT